MNVMFVMEEALLMERVIVMAMCSMSVVYVMVLEVFMNVVVRL